MNGWATELTINANNQSADELWLWDRRAASSDLSTVKSRCCARRWCLNRDDDLSSICTRRCTGVIENSSKFLRVYHSLQSQQPRVSLKRYQRQIFENLPTWISCRRSALLMESGRFALPYRSMNLLDNCLSTSCARVGNKSDHVIVSWRSCSGTMFTKDESRAQSIIAFRYVRLYWLPHLLLVVDRRIDD